MSIISVLIVILHSLSWARKRFWIRLPETVSMLQDSQHSPSLIAIKDGKISVMEKVLIIFEFYSCSRLLDKLKVALAD